MGITTLLYAQTIAPKKCNTCGKPLVQCKYKGKHPSSQTKLTSLNQVSETKSQVSADNASTNKDHEWVDLGLPSGTKWATMNIGASSPSNYGSYFAWGETFTKMGYVWRTLKYCLDDYGTKFSKYVTDSKYGNVDGKKELDLIDDVASVNWGSSWRMPSQTQLNELREKCKWIWTNIGGNNGYKVVGLNGNYIFLPAAGYYTANLEYAGMEGYYGSRSLFLEWQRRAYCLFFGSGGACLIDIERASGFCVRAVFAN